MTIEELREIAREKMRDDNLMRYAASFLGASFLFAMLGIGITNTLIFGLLNAFLIYLFDKRRQEKDPLK